MSYFYFKPRTKQAWLDEKEIMPTTYSYSNKKFSEEENRYYFNSGDKLGNKIQFCVIWNPRRKKGSLRMKKKEKEEEEFFFEKIEGGTRYKSIVDLKEED